MDHHTQKFIQQLRSVALSDKERESLRSTLIDTIRENKVARPVPSPWAWFLHAQHVQVAFLLLVIVISYGSTVTLSAENSLPGETLYPVKTFVAEPLARLITANTPSAQATFETKLLNERLKEAEALDTQSKLGATLRQTVREGIRAQSIKAETRVSDAAEESRAAAVASTSPSQILTEEGPLQGSRGGSEEADTHTSERVLQGVLNEHKRILEKLDLVNGSGGAERKGE